MAHSFTTYMLCCVTGLSAGAIVGIIIGVLVIAVVAVGLVQYQRGWRPIGKRK